MNEKIKTVCGECKVHLKGDKDASVVSDGLCVKHRNIMTARLLLLSEREHDKVKSFVAE